MRTSKNIVYFNKITS